MVEWPQFFWIKQDINSIIFIAMLLVAVNMPQNEEVPAESEAVVQNEEAAPQGKCNLNYY